MLSEREKHAANFKALGRARVQNIIDSHARTVSNILSLDPSATGLIKVANKSLELARSLSKRIETKEPPPVKMACQAGCHWCCCQEVEVSVPELLLISSFLNDNGLSISVSESSICPLLLDKQCIAYAVRPLPCIGTNSFDASHCEDAFYGRPVQVEAYGKMTAICTAISIGLFNGLKAVGRDPEWVSLSVLSKVDKPFSIGDRWLKTGRLLDD